MGKELILIPFGNNVLALSQEDFKKALSLGYEITGTVTVEPEAKPTERLLDAEDAGKMTEVPASWFLEAARQERIPHVRMGKYVRFRMSDVLQALEVRPRHEAKVTSARFKAV